MIRSSAIISCSLAFAMLFVVSGCARHSAWSVPPSAKTLRNPIPASSETLSQAAQLYMANCARCHRDDGTGRRPPLSMLSTSVPPANFTDAKMMDAMTDGEIFWKITEGRRPMPSFKNKLTDDQRWELVNFLRLFAHPPANSAAPANPKP